MTLYIIGLGLHDYKDITLRGMEYIKQADTIYLEHYTSILSCSKEELENAFGKEVLLATRDLVEKEAETKLIGAAKEKNIVLLVVGDVFGATTHTDLMLRAKEAGVAVEVVFNASILTAVGITGLELYKYGKTTSIVFPDDNWLPLTPYSVIEQNRASGLHTLCLLDIKVAEQSKEDMLKNRSASQPPRYMTVAQGLDVLMRLEHQEQKGLLTLQTKVIGVARLGQPDYKVVYGTIAQLLELDLGLPLHSLIVPGNLHFVEEESLEQFALR